MKQLRRPGKPVAAFVRVDLQRAIGRSNTFGFFYYVTEVRVQSRVLVILVEAELEKLDFVRCPIWPSVEADGVERVPIKKTPPELDAVKDVEQFLVV